MQLTDNWILNKYVGKNIVVGEIKSLGQNLCASCDVQNKTQQNKNNDIVVHQPKHNRFPNLC